MAKKKKYIWDFTNPPLIEDHSLVKQDILQSYLEKYIEILCADYRMDELKLTIVDGFCGGGEYVTETGDKFSGSPIIALRAIKTAEAKIQLQRKKPFRISAEYHFIDNEPTAIAMLNQHIVNEGYKSEIDNSIFLHTISFHETVQDLVARIRNRQPRTQRAIFILDQYNYSAVPFPIIQYLFKNLSHPEVILNFGKDLLINYLTDSQEYRKVLGKIGLTSDKVEFLATIKEEGDGWKRKAQAGLSSALHEYSGAKNYTPFFIKSKKSNQAYWLVHLSNHVKARNVMTDLHWEQHNSFQHFGGGGLNMLGFDATKIAYENQTVFSFDQAADALTGDVMMEDLPRFIHQTGDISFGDLMSKIANETPAKEEQVVKALVNLRGYKEFEIYSSDNKIRERTKTIHSTDYIKKPNQLVMSLANKRKK